MANELFISYARKDLEFLEIVRNFLVDRGIHPWIDRDKIAPAAPWREACLEGARRCDSFLFLISPISILSPACAFELEEAINSNRRIIPMLILPMKAQGVHPALARLNWLRFDEDRRKALGQLADILASPLGSLIHIADYPSALLKIVSITGEEMDRPLFQGCYWIGREPKPPCGAAGVINLADKNPDKPAISVLHAILVVEKNRWVAMDTSKNGSLLIGRGFRGKLPAYPPGWFLEHGDELHIFGNRLIYREVFFDQPEQARGVQFPTFPGFDLD